MIEETRHKYLNSQTNPFEKYSFFQKVGKSKRQYMSLAEKNSAYDINVPIAVVKGECAAMCEIAEI
jgi:hypothetical protein